MHIHTDLARETREINPDIPGVRDEEEIHGDASVNRIYIDTDEAAAILGKPAGRYITIEAPKLVLRDSALFRAVSRLVAKELGTLLGALPGEALVLVAGLGNRYITPDALGPRVIEKTFITRHIRERLPDIIGEPMRAVAALAPGVLGTTGMETLEVLKGVIQHTRPAALVVVDALASRRAGRINTAIQLTDTGIHPGSGVGNDGRLGLTPATLGVPVVAIGVPTVVMAITILRDALTLIAKRSESYVEEEMLQAAEGVINDTLGPMIVTPKEIDTIIADMAGILAEAINLALHKPYFDKIKELMA
ncbi:MAG: GPR endopeptidase [Clostridiales bacterium]|jgi:spore protease|nr:GPR endopeptidase [Clostridiales bacterium]